MLIVPDPAWNEYDCKLLKSKAELDQLHFDRLMLMPCQEWLDAGSVVCVIFRDGEPIAYGWSHFRQHNIKYVGCFELGDDIAWVGPQFVHKLHRGHGLQRLLVYQCVLNMPDNIRTVITSVNQSNLPSLRSFEKMKFHIGAKVSTLTGFLSSHVSNLKITDEESVNYFKLPKK